MPTGDAYSSGHLVPSPWDLHMFYLLRPIPFPNLSLFFRTMLFEYPSELSRFCLEVFVIGLRQISFFFSLYPYFKFLLKVYNSNWRYFIIKRLIQKLITILRLFYVNYIFTDRVEHCIKIDTKISLLRRFIQIYPHLTKICVFEKSML